MKDVTVIIPIGNTLEKDDITLLTNAVKSAVEQCAELIVIGPAELSKHAAKLTKLGKNIKILENDTPNYVSNVNKALKDVNTEYFSVLEYDDTFSPKWFENVEKYMEYDDEDKFGFLPLTELVDYETKETIGYANEAFWASSFSDEIGYLDIGALENYLGFNTSGGVFRKKDFLTLGGLKESMKLVFWYEFLFRAIYKEKKIFVVPKVGYYHVANRPNSLTESYSNEMSDKEAEWWVELAKKEYFFPQDRKKVYEEE